jgi:hypothetical protein
MTTVALGDERWHVIEFPEVLLKRWQRALDRRELMPLRYCGSLRYVNPRLINYMAAR